MTDIPSTDARRNGGIARAERLTPDERAAISRKGGLARAAALTPERRTEIARKGGDASAKVRYS